MKFWTSALCFAALGSGCAGDFDPNDDGPDDSVIPETDQPTADGWERIPSDDPMVDARLNTLGIVCESQFTVTGTFVAGDPPPEDHRGCWPVGTWTVQAQLEQQGCDPQPALPADYVYTVVFDEETVTQNVSFTNAPDDDRVNLKISTAGDGLCHGSMEHFGTDNTVWMLQPTLQENGTLQGIGVFSVYDEDPF